MNNLSKRWHAITTRQAIDTGMAFTLICLLVHIFFETVPYLHWAALGFLLVAMTIPSLLKPLAVLWFWFSEVLGGVMSKVLLSVIFFLVIVPIGMISQVVRKDPLKLNHFKSNKKTAGSLFINRNKTFSADDIRYPY